MSGYLTTHILDTASGIPAKGVDIDLFRIVDGKRNFLKSTITNDDGRTDAPILPADEFQTGTYELVFKVGRYLRETSKEQGTVLFLDEIPVRFRMAEHNHYHVPLLLSPFGYSTYRGS